MKSPSHRFRCHSYPARNTRQHLCICFCFLLDRATAWLLEQRGQRLGHVCMGCNPPRLAHGQPYGSQDQAVQNWPKLSGSPK